MMKNERQKGIKIMNTFTDIKDLVDDMFEEHPTCLRHITSHDVEVLLKSPLESYIIDIDSPTILSDIVFKLQRMGLGEFTSEKEIYELIVMYEKNYQLSLDYVIELFNEMVRRYYQGVLEMEIAS